MSCPLVVMAMEAEAAPVRAALGLAGDGDLLHPAFPARLWRHERVCLAVNGIDPRFGVDSIGTQPAVVTTLHAAEAVDPTIVISAGTCGGFAGRGAEIGSVYLAGRSLFHDRRIDLPGFDAYGDGDYPVAPVADVASAIGAEEGTISTGNALDAPVGDVRRMHDSGAVAKDMEAAAVAWVCERIDVPFTALKVVTDLVDTGDETAEQFLLNLRTATDRLADAVPRLIDALGRTST